MSLNLRAAHRQASPAQPPAQPTANRPDPSLSARGSALRWLPTLAVLLLAVVLAPQLVDYARHSWDVLTFPWQIDFDEGVNLNASWLLSQGTNIYRPYTPDHFVSALYPPLYYLLNALALKLWGLNLWSGRLLALLGALGVGGGLWAWVRIETGKHWPGLLAALVWFSLGPVYVWSTFYKQDLPALALGVAGGAMAAFFFTRPGRAHARAWLYWSLVPLALSFWMKQSSLAPLAAVGVALLMYDWRLAVRWGLLAAASLAVPFAALALLTKGGFLEHMLAFNEFGRSATRFEQRAQALWTYHYPLVLAGLAFLIVFLVLPPLRRRTPPLSAVFLFISIPATILGILHPTGNYNHLLNILAPLCLALGVACGVAWQQATGGRAVGWAALGLCALVVVGQLGAQSSKPAWTWYTPLGMPLAERAGQMQKLSDVIKKTPGDIFSEDAWLLLSNGKRVLYDDPAGMTAIANAGAWDQSTFVQDLQRRKYSLLLLEYDLTNETYNPRWTAEALHAAQDNYAVLFRDVVFAHAPKPPGDTPLTSAGCAIESGPTLTGYTFRSQVANHGDVLPLSLYWRNGTRGTSGQDVKFFVKLVDGSGTPHWSADLVPGQAAGKPLTAGWVDGETVRDDLAIPVDQKMPFGQYSLLFGAYSVQNGQIAPLKLACAQPMEQQGDGVIVLSKVDLVQRWGK